MVTQEQVNNTTNNTTTNNRDQPLGLARGSVRSIIAIILTIAAVIMGLAALGYGIASNTLQDPLPIIMFVLGLAQVAIGFYFVSRANGSNS